MNNPPLFFAGSSHRELAIEICTELKIPLGAVSLGSFPDGEISVEILEGVQGRDVFILQSLAVDPTNADAISLRPIRMFSCLYVCHV